MATQDGSPSLFIGQSWTNWAEIMTIAGKNDEDEEDKADTKSDDSDSMKLDKKDMGLFGFCPSQDEFTLALCETCNLLVKPQALKRHIENRHGINSCQTTTVQSSTPLIFISELAKTLSLPVTSFSPRTVNKPPTKASLKQVPEAVHMLGPGLMAGSGAEPSLRMSSSRPFRKANTNPVVNLERMPEQVASVKKQVNAVVSSDASSPLSGLTTVTMTTATTPTALTKIMSSAPQVSCGSPNNAKLSIANGGHRISSGMSLSSLPSVSSHPVTTLATQPSALTTTTTSVTCTRPTPTTLPVTVSSASVTAFAKTVKPAGVPLLTSAVASSISTSTLCPVPVFTAVTAGANSCSGSKSSKKSPKERKFLPCKDREFDANKHCGVIMEDTGKPCTRSLTCKTHALGLRRAVPGRMKSFDELLREHKAAKDALMKAKAQEQAAAAARAGISSKDTNLLVTSGATNAALNSPAALAASAIKLGPIGASSHRDIKSGALLSPAVVPRPVRSPGVFQRFAPGGVFPPSLTVKEEPSPIIDSSPHLSQSSDQEWDGVHEKSDITYLTHHPRPAAMCTFSARLAGGRCALFSRRTDLVRAAFLSALERQLNPPPHKKLCVESNLPKELQMPSNSKDPYEFTMVDTTLGGQQCQSVSFSIGGSSSVPTCTSPSKTVLKHRAKAVISPSLSFPVTSVTVSASHTPAAVTMPAFTAAMLKPSKPHEVSPAHRSPSMSSGSLSLAQTFPVQPAKRKRISSNQGGLSPAHSIASGGVQAQGHNVGLALSSGTSTGLAGMQQQPQTAVLTSVGTVNSHAASTPLTAITIPNVSLANAATLGLSATLPTAKQHQGSGQKTSIIKDLNFVLTSIDPSLVNGQYVNITGAQLAELAAAQAVSATAEDKNIKRSRLGNAKHISQKLSGSTLEAFRTLQGSSVLTAVPPNAVLVDGSLQGAVLAPVSSLGGAGASGSSSSAFVTLAASAVTASQASTSITVTPTTIFRTVGDSGTPHQVKLTSALFANGIISATDKAHSTSSSHHQQQQVSNAGSTTLVRTSSGHSKTVAQGILQSPLCTGQALTAHFKPSTINFTKGVGGKLTVQPVSVTIPLVGQVGLGALASSQPQGSHSQHTLLVTTAAEDGSGGSGGKTEIHLQPQISSSPSGLLS